jgi:hypothetical protein
VAVGVPLAYSSYCTACNNARRKLALGSAYCRRYRNAWELKHRCGLSVEERHEMASRVVEALLPASGGPARRGP